jgi:glycosyltransferase involved in cell wall biosynthesis
MSQVQAALSEVTNLRIALVGPLPPPPGGIANQTEQLARLLQEAGMRVTAVRVNEPYRPQWVARLRVIRAAFRLPGYLYRLWKVAVDSDVLHVMANSGWAWHLFAAPAICIGRARGVAVVVNYRGGGAEGFLARQHRWVLPTLRRADAVIVPSGFLQKVMERWGVAAKIVPNVVDLERFRPGAPDPGRLEILIARNLEPIYDVATAIRAFSVVRTKLPHARLTVAGSGPCREQLEELCAHLCLEEVVRFTGRLESSEMAQLYQTADIVLNPARVDNAPNSLLEAMAAGVPIVTTNVGGIPYLVEHEATALLVPPSDPDAMAEAALRLVSDPALAARLRSAGLRLAQTHTWSAVKPRLLDVYGSIVGRTRAIAASTL